MVAETKVNPASSDTLAPLAVARGTGEVLVDAMTLAELQFQLAELDLQDAKQRLTGGVSLLAIGAVLGASTIPALLGACGLFLAQAAKMELGVALLIVVGITLLIAAAILAWGWRKLQFRGVLFTRSRSEWRQNAKWLKAMLRQSGSRKQRSESLDGDEHRGRM